MHPSRSRHRQSRRQIGRRCSSRCRCGPRWSVEGCNFRRRSPQPGRSWRRPITYQRSCTLPGWYIACRCSPCSSCRVGRNCRCCTVRRCSRCRQQSPMWYSLRPWCKSVRPCTRWAAATGRRFRRCRCSSRCQCGPRWSEADYNSRSSWVHLCRSWRHTRICHYQRYCTPPGWCTAYRCSPCSSCLVRQSSRCCTVHRCSRCRQQSQMQCSLYPSCKSVRPCTRRPARARRRGGHGARSRWPRVIWPSETAAAAE